MIHIISPAKSLDFETEPKVAVSSIPQFENQSAQIMKKLRGFSKNKLKDLMGISDNLAELNYHRNQYWTISTESKEMAKQAIYAFSGDVYTGLDAYTLSLTDIEYAQNHLRILSGLYGLLKPMDLILPYRLEMGTSIGIAKSKSLYDFWNKLVTKELNESLKGHHEKALINLASNEYFKAIDTKKLEGHIIHPVFKDEKNGKLKIISFFAKKARGLMSNYIIKNKISSVEDLKGFDYEGYHFDNKLSTDKELIFVRAENWK